MGETVSTGATTTVTATTTSVSAIAFELENEPEQPGTAVAAGSSGTPTLSAGTFRLPPLRAVEIKAKLSGFVKPPKTAKLDLFSAVPPETGGKPVATVNATKKSATEASGSFTFDPKKHKLANVAFVRATVDGAPPAVSAIGVDAQGAFELKWDKAGPLVRPGQEVGLKCRFVGFKAPTNAKFELFAAHEKDALDKATAFKTLTPAEKGDALTATWTVESPPDAPPPAEGKLADMPGVVFVVKIDKTQAVSPVQGVLPDLEIRFEPGDPNLLFEPIVGKKAAFKGEGQPGATDPNKNPDAKSGKFPNRVLGIKQRLQHLGFYYEMLPIPKDVAGLNRQTRVFRKCVRWFWKNVSPGPDKKDPIPMTDETGYDPAKDPEQPPRGPRRIDFDKIKDDWFLDLEKRVREGAFGQDPQPDKKDPPPAAGTLDFAREVKVIQPGDIASHGQELLLDDPKNVLDWTRKRIKKPYDQYIDFTVIDNSTNDPKFADYRHIIHRIYYDRNPTLAACVLVARPRMKRKDGKLVDGPASGLRIIFQLIPVADDDTKDPTYFTTLDLRSTSRVVKRLGAFGKDPTPPANAGDPPPKGPRTYLKELHAHFKKTKPNPEADPTWWNASADHGGRRDDAARAAGRLLGVGPNGRAIGARDDENFPWSALDASKPNAAHQLPYPRAVSVPVIGGRAALVIGASRLAGDSYRVRAFVEPPRVPGAPAPKAAPAPVGESKTDALTVWKRVRITRYFQKAVPKSWPDDAVRELGGPLADINWENVGKIFKQAFFILEPPAAKRELTAALRDKAIEESLKVLAELTKPLPGKPGPSLAALRTRGDAGALRGPTPPFDFSRMFRVCDAPEDTPYIFDVRDLDDYFKDPASKRAPGTNPGSAVTDTEAPIEYYSHTASDVIFFLTQVFASHLDEDDPPGSQDFDPVPAPGLTCIQALHGDNITGSMSAGRFVGLSASELTVGGDLVTLATDLRQDTTSGRAQFAPEIVARYTHESGGTFVVRRANPASFKAKVTFQDVFDAFKQGLTALGVTGVTAPAIVNGRLVFEMGPTPLTAANSDPIAEINVTGKDGAGVSFVPTKDASGFTGTSPPFLTKDGAPATDKTFIGDLKGMPDKTPVAPWISLDRDDGTRNTPQPTATKASGENERRLPADARQRTFGELVALFLQLGCTQAKVLADGSVEVKFPSARKKAKPRLELRGTVIWYPFRREDLPNGRVRFTSEGRYTVRKNTRTVQTRTTPPLDPATDVAPGAADLSDLNEGVTLSPGDTIRLERHRAQDDTALLARKKPFDPTPLDPESRPIFKKLEFVYGDPDPAKPNQGRTVAALVKFIGDHVTDLSRDDDLVFVGRQEIQFRWFYFLHKSLYKKFGKDGLSFEFVVIRKENDPDTGKPRVLRNAWVPFDRPTLLYEDADVGDISSSGIAPGNRVFYVTYGKTEYDNAGAFGEDPDKKGGRGFFSPSDLFSYDLDTNAAHELGHTLYLRHHWTGNAGARPVDHDHDDICCMGYFTSFVDLGDGKKALSVPVEDILAGKHRDAGRAQLCARCMLRLRGWHMGRDATHVPPNVPPVPPKAQAHRQFPLAEASFIKDWLGSRTAPGGGSQGPPVPPPPPPPPPPVHHACVELAGGHFDFDRSFVRKDGVVELARVHEEMANRGAAQAMVFGHTDTVGTEQYNKLLSERRARSVLAVLTHDADAWEELRKSEGWGVKPIQVMLNAVKPASDPLIAEDDIEGDETHKALARFQERRSLAKTGKNDAATRRALYVDYMRLAAATPVDAARFKDFGGTRCMGCSEFNPMSASTGKDEASRRVEVMVFDPANDPKDLPCRIGDIAPCKASLLAAGEKPEKRPPEGANYRCKVYLRLSALCPGASA